ncbi:MAG: hypothetical protein ACJZ72_12865 [Opitutales bacterium]
MKKAHIPIVLVTFLIPVFMCAGKNVGGVSGSLETVIQAGSTTTPSYAVVSAGIASDPIYSGQIESTPTTTTVFFESSSDASETTVNPFVSGVFNSSVKSPILTASLSGAGVGSITITYAGSGFSTAPEIVIDFPTTGDDQAFAVCTLNGSGGIASVTLKDSAGSTVSTSGSGYDAAPSVSIVGGPHFLKLTESGDDDEGRVFLITDNNATRLTLDITNLAAGETLDNVLQDDFSVEIIPATTLGSAFGTTVASNPLTSGKPDTADYVYLWSDASQFFEPYFFLTPAVGSYGVGWYNRYNPYNGLANDFVVYPDEGFIVGRRTNSNVTLSFEGSASGSSQKLRLPAVNKQVVMNNPYGGDLLLAEIIPTQYIGTGANDFRPGSNEDDAQADQLYFLRANGASAWSRYWYQSGYNDGVTAVATATAKAGSGGSGALTANDVSLASGTITNLQSCNASGSIVDHNVSDHTLITLSASNAPLAGFDVTFKGVFGKKLNDNGDKELDINGTEVTAGGGINIFSGLIGTYKIIRKHAANKIVVRKQRDVNFDSSKGAKSWSTGNVGAGYSTNSSKKAKVYFLGGGGTGAHGTFFNADNPKVTVVSGGSGYTSAPQAIITGGGWRLENAGASVEDNATLGATEGMIILRKNPSGALTYIKGSNPFQ